MDLFSPDAGAPSPGPGRLPLRQAAGVLMVLVLLAGGRVLRQRLLVGPDGAWLPAVAAATQPDTASTDSTVVGGDLSGAGAVGAALAGSPPAGSPPAASPAAGSLPPKAALTGLLPINTCSQDSLRLLPGVGPVLAGRIAQARAEGLVFRRAADLQAVKGIGPKLAARLDSLVLYAPAKTRAGSAPRPKSG